MQFYATVHFYPHGSLKWMTYGVRYEATMEEWVEFLGLPPHDDNLVHVYRKEHMRHEELKGVYMTDLTKKQKEDFKLGSIYFLSLGLAIINDILRVSLLP